MGTGPRLPRVTGKPGALAATFLEAMRLWDAMKADGISRVVRLATLTKTLKAAWPFTREWKFFCSNCDDFGLVISFCSGDETCGRNRPHGPHEFGTPCLCAKGHAFRAKVRTAEDYTAATKVRQPTRLGR